MMVLKPFWGSPGLLLGALGGPWGAFSGLWIDQRGPPDSSWNSLGPRLLVSCCRKLPWEGSGAVFSSFLVLPRAFWGVFEPPSNRFRPSKLPFRSSISYFVLLLFLFFLFFFLFSFFFLFLFLLLFSSFPSYLATSPRLGSAVCAERLNY